MEATSERRGLWRYGPRGLPKYLVLRTADGSVVEMPFVLNPRDAAAAEALEAYADAAENLGYAPEFVADVRRLVRDFRRYRLEHGSGQPDEPLRDHPDPDVAAVLRGASFQLRAGPLTD